MIIFRQNMKWLIQTNASSDSEPSRYSCLSDYFCQATTIIGIQELLHEKELQEGCIHIHTHHFSSCNTLCMLIETLPDESIHAPEF